jgi:AcrR family transcriptional regulator
MLDSAPAPKQRRSVATRARLVDAAVASLVEDGLAGTSTPRVAARAGVSQGALFKHYPTKDQLLAAAVEAMLRGFVDDFRRHVAVDLGAAATALTTPALDPGDLVAPACAALWRIFRRPEMRAVFEIYVAAHTDDALAARLAPILDRHRAQIMTEARHLFPASAALPDFEDAVDAIVYAMQGAALGMFAPARVAAAGAPPLAFLERLARRELGLDGARPPRAARARR